ncbi:MAG: hypothetical protein FWF29_00375 [Treponema sp.]|nr:hypothetical protein [Treponema sp.]
MSYSRNYHASVEYSGSVTLNYPASEHGGSVSGHYSGNVPVDVTINVNTQPFDGSVSHFNSSVDGLTGSVVAMHGAQCAAIQQTAKDVSASLLNGFFGAINSELTQQMNALNSAIKAAFGLIAEQGKAVTEKNTQMEGDYNRISSRYVRLFDDLDTECHKRINALDRPAFGLSENVQQKLLTETPQNMSALNLLGIEEVSSAKTMMLVSSINRRVLDVIKTLEDYVSQEETISTKVNSLLGDEKIDENIQLAVPVIWTENVMTETGADMHEIFIPGFIDEQRRQEITKRTENICANASAPAWIACEEQDKEALDRQFKALGETAFINSQDETEQRIYQTMLSLWQKSEMNVLKGSIQ